MTRNNRYSSKLYSFLEQEGVLSTGDDNLIRTAKQKYWSLVRREWNKQKRLQSKSFTILFTVKETKIISKSAKQHGVSATCFIKQAAFDYASNKVVIEFALLREMREQLIVFYSDIEGMMEEHELFNQITDMILQRIDQLEKIILDIVTKHFSQNSD